MFTKWIFAILQYLVLRWNARRWGYYLCYDGCLRHYCFGICRIYMDLHTTIYWYFYLQEWLQIINKASRLYCFMTVEKDTIPGLLLAKSHELFLPILWKTTAKTGTAFALTKFLIITFIVLAEIVNNLVPKPDELNWLNS